MTYHSIFKSCLIIFLLIVAFYILVFLYVFFIGLLS